MAITTFSQLVGAAKERVALTKTAARTTITTNWFSLIDLAGNPGAGTLAGTSTTTGVVPTDATAGFPPINAFGGGNIGYLANVEFGGSVAARLRIVDLLWKAGAYAFNASTTGNTPASFASRVPDTDYSACEIWFEAVTAFTGSPTITVTYTNEAGTTGRTATIAIGTAPTVGRMIQIPLQAGDKGVQAITGVVATVATVGTFNLLIVRDLWSGRVRAANDGDIHGPDRTQMSRLYDDSALYLMVSSDSTTSGVPEIEMTIANG